MSIQQIIEAITSETETALDVLGHAQEMASDLRQELNIDFSLDAHHSENLSNASDEQLDLELGIIRALISAIDAKDPYTHGHSTRVAQIAVRLASEMGLDRESLDMVYFSGLLHDIGKIGIDDHVLSKPAKLTEAEYKHIQRHPEIGYHLLADIEKMQSILPAVLHHHESWDGDGYPSGLRSTDIPFTARLIAVADGFDAMSSDRPYRKRLPDENIDHIFRKDSARQWDPEIVKTFFRVRDDMRQIVKAPEFSKQHAKATVLSGYTSLALLNFE